jgi:multiple sugar transport system permease protein
MPSSNSFLSRKIILAFLGPALLLILVFLVFPAFWVLYLGLTDQALTGVRAVMPSFVGLKNFNLAFHDDFFYNALKLSFIFVIGSAWLGQALLGLVLSVVLYELKGTIKTVVSGAAVLAWIIPEVVVAYLWIAFLDKDFGLLNQILAPLGVARVNWLYAHPVLAIVFFNAWRGTAFSMLLFSSALETIPPSFIESARVMGANLFQRFFQIVLPQIRAILLTDLILITLWTFNVFTPFLLTGGGPSFHSEILPIYIWRTSFKYFKLGYGSSVSTILLVINLGFALLYLLAQRRKKHV